MLPPSPAPRGLRAENVMQLTGIVTARFAQRADVMSHPNRKKSEWNRPGRTPTPAEITRAREGAGKTQAAAADLVYTSVRTWEGWEQGRFPMPASAYELFLLKTDQSPLGRITGGTFDPPARYRGSEKA